MSSDAATLCSRDQAYNLREAHISNAVLLCSQVDPGAMNGLDEDSLDSQGNAVAPPYAVRSQLSTFIEALPRVATSDLLRRLLDTTRYAGPDEERLLLREMEANGQRLYTMDDIFNTVPACESEIKAWFEELGVLIVDGMFAVGIHHADVTHFRMMVHV